MLLALAPGLAACGSSSPARSAGSATTPHATVPSPTREVSPAGDIPDNQVYVRYAVPGAGYSVRVPEGWSRISRGGAVVFTDKLNAIRLETGAPAHHAGKAAVVHR